MLIQTTPYILYQTDDPGGGGTTGDSKKAVTDKQTGDQTDWQQKYVELSQQITDGKYVSHKSYATLQQKLQEANDARTPLMDEVATTKATVETLRSQVEELTTSKTTLEASLNEAKALTEAQQAKIDRTNYIIADYPHLLSFEAKGLLPDATPEKLPEVLKNFAELLGAQETAAKEEFSTGHTDPPTGKDELKKRTTEVIQREMNAAMMAGKLPEYENLRREYFESLGVPQAAGSKPSVS